MGKMFKIVLCLCLLHLVATWKILALLPYAGKSHFDAYEPLLKALATRGHEVTVVSHFPQKTPLPNYKDISIRGEDSHLNTISLDLISKNYYKFVSAMRLLYRFSEDTCSKIQDPSIIELVNTREKFDLALVELFVSDCFLGFVHKFNIPYIGLCSCPAFPWTLSLFATSANPAFWPITFSTFGDKMTFVERVESTIYYLYAQINFHIYFLPFYDKQARKLFGSDLPRLEDIALNASLMFVNTHFSLNLPKPMVPGIIEVGGMFLRQHKLLPQNIEKWINESDAGVIYLSMGSMIKGHSFPEETRDAFIRAFARLPQRVLWKWENDTLPGKTDNIMIQKWMPQFDILCHPNVKAYISHGGLLGTTEAVHCGVPAVVTPQYGDQFVNAAALQAGGGGVVLDFKTATEDTIYEALNNILQPNFQQQAKKLSERFRDRPMPPLETAIYWVEYVARHGGAHHMRTAAVGMPWYQYLLLDVVAFLAAVVITLLLITYFVLRTLWKLVMKTTTKAKKE